MRVVVCGAGIAGLALAHRLDAYGMEVTLLDKAPGPHTGGYMIDFFGPGYDAAEAMGLLPRLRELGYDVTEVAYIDEHGRRRAGFTYSDRVVSIMRPDLERALREQLRVPIHYGRTIDSIENGGALVRLDNEETLETDLLVGSDGIHSRVRALAFGPEERHLRFLGYHTAAFTFDDPELYARVDGRFCLTDTLHRCLGFYALRNGRVAAFAVHHADSPELPADKRAALREEYGPLAPTGIDQLFYDQVAQTVMPRWSAGRVVLLGDSAYAVSLLAGQGASMAVAGAHTLATALSRAPSIEEALSTYEGSMRPLIAKRQRQARRTARWFVPANRAQRLVRRVALRTLFRP